MITNQYDFEPNYGRKEGIYMPTEDSQEYFSRKARQRREWGYAACGCILAGLIILAYAIIVPVSNEISYAIQNANAKPPAHQTYCFTRGGTLIPRDNYALVPDRVCHTL